MDNKDFYEVYFVGQDYQPISNAASSMKILHDGEECVIDLDARQILDHFLNEIAPNGYCTNNSIAINSEQGKTKKLYDINFGSNEDKGYFCGVVGVIRKTIQFKFGDESKEQTFRVTLQIKSRLDVNAEQQISKPFFLSTMLLRDKLSLSNNTIPSNEDEIFDYLLLFWYKEQLQNACLKGHYKTYRRFENNDDRVKGTIDISRHIRMNIGQKNGKVAYSYRENTINNSLNQLIVVTYYHLKNKYYDLVADNFDKNNELKKVIDFLSEETNSSQVKMKDIINKNLKPIAHPYFTEYEKLRIICLRILRNEGISIFDGESSDETQGILFYLPELWEKFLEDKLITPALHDGIKMESQKQIDNFGSIEKDEYEYKYNQPTYPDYVFFDKNKPLMILDAKCKPRWECVFDNKSSVRDVMEDYNKCIRDMVATNTHATGVIFPTNMCYDETEANRVLCHRISEYNPVDMFYTIPISVPTVEENDLYFDWISRFEKTIEREINTINKILQNEIDFANKNAESKANIVR